MSKHNMTYNHSPCALPLRDRGTQRARWAGSLAILAPNPNPKSSPNPNLELTQQTSS